MGPTAELALSWLLTSLDSGILIGKMGIIMLYLFKGSLG